MRMTASWFRSLDLPDTRLWRDLNRARRRAPPLIVITDRTKHLNLLTKKAPYKGRGADFEEKHEPASDVEPAVDAERIGFYGKSNDVLLFARKVSNDDARQTVLALKPYEPIHKEHERQHIDAGPVRNDIAPAGATWRRERRPGNLKIFRTVGVGPDD